jgi:HSP20 family protein
MSAKKILAKGGPALDGNPEEPEEKNVFEQDGELVVDVFETEADFMVSAAIAGVQIKDIDISLEKDMMVIKGSRCDPHEHPNKKYFYQECYWGPFSRKIVLPDNIDIDKADAQMDKGVLTIKIPKNQSNGKGKIGVKTA